ncbi:alpha/beta fold hydrolase [Alkalicaulis satelles]|uniref:Alpha/beta fold hydrolase n=1 Tax=Alkalicaulis satelles TaxID=2609175 RepID=A0A5M6ZFA9_9PROT|nr:alpha/beta fold hydrolase [Alkalicaulis satelles]KAA5803426.1 alpha/beta fold hydrolase [Alkalicaulis satelles]
MSAAVLKPPLAPWPVEDLVCGYGARSGGWYEATGRLAGAAEGPAAIVLGGISAGRRLLDDADGPGWWPGVAGPGGALNPRTGRFLSLDFLGEAARPFPSVEDQADAALALADAAGLDRFTLVGASYGGMTALAIAAAAPERVIRADILCAAARPHPMATAWRAIQREIVHLGLETGRGAEALDLARRLAMTTYRTPEEFAARFDGPEAVQSYLAARGGAWARETRPERFLVLSQSMDAVDIAVEAIAVPVRFLAINSDRLVPPEDVEAAAARMPRASITRIDSLYGHDGFLKETEAVNAFLRGDA